MTSLRKAAMSIIGMVAAMSFFPVTVEAAGGPSAAPFEVDVFVRGSFNGWGTGHRMKFDAKGGQYVAQVELVPGGYEFKIASEDWATVDLGAADDGYVELGVPEPVMPVTFNNLYLEVAEAGVYSFTLDTSNMAALAVTVAPSRPGGDGAEKYFLSFQQDWYFDCLGSGQVVQSFMDIKGILHVRQNPRGGFHVTDSWQMDGVAFDEDGNEYRVHGAAPLTFNAPPSGATTVSNLVRLAMTPLRGGTSLFFTFTEKVTINANGVVVRAFSASDFRCSR
jgi:pullulanase